MNNPFEYMQNAMNQNNFVKNLMIAEMNDITNFSKTIKKNMEVLSSCGQEVFKEGQSILEKNIEKIQKCNSEMFNSSKDAVLTGDADKLSQTCHKYFKTNVENNVSNTKEVIDLMSKLSLKAFDQMSKKMSDDISNFTKSSKTDKK